MENKGMINDLNLKIEGGYLCALKKKWKMVVLKKKRIETKSR